MAIVKSTLGKLSGKLGNLVLYEGRDGETLCRSESVGPRRQTERQKRHSEAFGALMRAGRFLMPVVRLGFPGEPRFPAGVQGFVRANVNTAVTVAKIKPDKEVSARKRAPQEFRGVIDFSRLQVSAGSLGVPEGVTAEVDAEARTVRFVRREMDLESPCRFRDDELYGVVVSAVERPRCRVFPLGVRGAADDRSVKITGEHFRLERSAVYVFARSADGTKASPSVCLLCR